jgi:thioredoxin 1
MRGVFTTSPSMLPTIDHDGLSKLGPGVTMIDFTAQWCGPCRIMEPVLVALSKEYAGRAAFVAVDCDTEPLLVQQFNVRSMPTFVVLRDGREVGRIVGSRPRAFVAGVLDRVLGGDVAVASP